MAHTELSAAEPPERNAYFTIRVVDDQTGRGVPLVELKTTNGVRYWTDSAGVVAFYEPGLMDTSVFFYVSSHGYEFPQDGFGIRGKALQVTPGGSVTLEIRRLNIAERLYRMTGVGIYRDTVLTGGEPPIAQPLLNAQVAGSDSVVTAVYRGRIHWFWGDTQRPKYPLGNFHVPGATSRLPADGGLDPEVGVNLDYFIGEDGFARATCQMPGEGPTWIFGLTIVPDSARGDSGEGEDGDVARMFAHYMKIKPPLDVYRRGLAEWDNDAQEFKSACVFPDDMPLHPGGHTFRHVDDGVEYVYYAMPCPLIRVRATPAALEDPTAYEAFTCLESGSTLDDAQLDRDADGRLRYRWRPNTAVVGPQEQRQLVREKQLQADEGLIQLQDRDTGRPWLAHAGSVYWNEHRRRWVMIAVEQYGTSFLGEVWYAEADTPVGPWAYAVKILTHDKYSFYNPKQHPFFDADGGRTIFFEGTYTASFSGNEHPTPRYEYNQMMYRLDLDDPRLLLPVAVYQTGRLPVADGFRTRGAEVDDEPRGQLAFYAPDRPFPGSRAVYVAAAADGGSRLVLGDEATRGTEFHSVRRSPERDQTVASGIRDDGRSETPSYESAAPFHALPPDAANASETTALLYEFRRRSDGQLVYSTDNGLGGSDYERSDEPVCRVWRSPFAAWPVAREDEAR